jgi:hypothetical protein
MEFAYEGGGVGQSGTATLFTDGKRSAGKIGATPFVFSADDCRRG